MIILFQFQRLIIGFWMFHNVKNVNALPDFKLSVQFCEGVTKIYNVAPLFWKVQLLFIPQRFARAFQFCNRWPKRLRHYMERWYWPFLWWNLGKRWRNWHTFLWTYGFQRCHISLKSERKHTPQGYCLRKTCKRCWCL